MLKRTCNSNNNSNKKRENLCLLLRFCLQQQQQKSEQEKNVALHYTDKNVEQAQVIYFSSARASRRIAALPKTQSLVQYNDVHQIDKQIWSCSLVKPRQFMFVQVVKDSRSVNQSWCSGKCKFTDNTTCVLWEFARGESSSPEQKKAPSNSFTVTARWNFCRKMLNFFPTFSMFFEAIGSW